MTERREGAATTGALVVAGAACAACCAGPILGVIAAIAGLGAIGVALFGAVALLVIAPLATYLIARRRRRVSCATEPVAVDFTSPRR
jgi:hypothetical protein